MYKISLRSISLIILGSIIYALGTHCFVSPAEIAPGGASGIALMANFLFGLPIGTITLIINIPLLILAWFYVSKRFVFNTSIACIISAIILDGIVVPFVPQYAGDRFIGSLFGGVVVGMGMALIFMAGSTTGGSDIVGKLLQKKAPHVSMGRALLIIDGIILGISIFVFNNIESGLFGMVSLFASTQIIDSIMYGIDKGCQVTVVTKFPEEIGKRVIDELDRSATISDAKGAYSMGSTQILLCAVRKPQFSQLKSIIYDVDPKAFVMVTETTEVFGEGFKDIFHH